MDVPDNLEKTDFEGDLWKDSTQSGVDRTLEEEDPREATSAVTHEVKKLRKTVENL